MLCIPMAVFLMQAHFCPVELRLLQKKQCKLLHLLLGHVTTSHKLIRTKLSFLSLYKTIRRLPEFYFKHCRHTGQCSLPEEDTGWRTENFFSERFLRWMWPSHLVLKKKRIFLGQEMNKLLFSLSSMLTELGWLACCFGSLVLITCLYNSTTFYSL